MATTVYFATNRVVANDGTHVADYNAGMVPSSDPTTITYGRAFVEGSDLAAGRSGHVVGIEDVSQGGFSAGAFGSLAAPGRNILVFIHGFDNSFADAITRAAFNRDWFAASGTVDADMNVVAFAWPSLGRAIDLPIPWADYLHDQTMAGRSGMHVTSFFIYLQPLLQQARASGTRCYLLCHSMGNYALQAAVETWFTHDEQPVEMFDEAILAAADERRDSFSFPKPGRLSCLAQLAGRVSIYFSEADLVLALSAAVNGIRRLGQNGPTPDAEATSAFRLVNCAAYHDYRDGPLSSHQYYRLSPGVRANIVELL